MKNIIANTAKMQLLGKPIFVYWMVAMLSFCFLSSLGIWQIQRLTWKNNLIARVNERVHLPPRPAPSKEEWPVITAVCCDYIPVHVTGCFLHDKETFVNALTVYGSGYWVLTPFEMEDGSIIIINRGFIPMDKKQKVMLTANQIKVKVTISGIMRMEEKNGFYPRRNDPAADIWYTRELSAIAKARGLSEVAPYFIDANTAPSIKNTPTPISGLTVITFPNNHLTYAVTWFALAGGILLTSILVALHDKNSR